MPKDFHADKSTDHFSQPTGVDGETQIEFDGKTWTVVEDYDGLKRIERETSNFKTVQKYVRKQGDIYVEIDIDT